MVKPKMFEKPTGVRDYLPADVRKLKRMETKVLSCMQKWGYEEIRTPALEFYDTVGTASATSEQKLFKLLDKNGVSMVLRSDLTAPIARVVSSLLKDEPLPLRLAYHANVFRAIEEEAGRDAEFFQSGVELIGDASAEADAEIVALAIETLQAAGIEESKIALGHVGFLNGLFRDALPNDNEVQESLKSYLLRRNYVGYTELVEQLAVSNEAKAELLGVLRLHGGTEICRQARLLTQDAEAGAAIDHLCKVFEVLQDYGVSDRLMIDLTMIGNFSYYTGMIFEGYAEGVGFPVCSGGRYDNLLEQFGRPAPATGFALKTNRILDVVSNEPEPAPYRILILYHARRHKEAIQWARDKRESLDIDSNVIVETRRIETGEAWRPELNGAGYDEVIEFT